LKITFKVRTPAQKLSFTQRKKQIQESFRTEMGLLVDVVLQGNYELN